MKVEYENFGMKSTPSYYRPPSYAAYIGKMKSEDGKVGMRSRDYYYGCPPGAGAYFTSSSFQTRFLDELIDSVGQGFWLGAAGGLVYGSIKSRRLTLTKVPRAAGLCALFTCLVFDAAPQIALVNLPRQEWNQSLNWPLRFGCHASGAAVMFAHRGLRVASLASLLTGTIMSFSDPLFVYLFRRD